MLAGDWTRNGIDGGCVESAALRTTGGPELTGHDDPISGESTTWLTDGAAARVGPGGAAVSPAYQPYGPRDAVPPPFYSRGGSFLVLLLEGNQEQLEALVKTMLDDPAEGAVSYTVPSKWIAMQVGSYESLGSRAPGFVSDGVAPETSIAFWVPLLASKAGAKYVALNAPFVYVDQPMSLSSGREVFGYPEEPRPVHPGSVERHRHADERLRGEVLREQPRDVGAPDRTLECLAQARRRRARRRRRSGTVSAPRGIGNAGRRNPVAGRRGHRSRRAAPSSAASRGKRSSGSSRCSRGRCVRRSSSSSATSRARPKPSTGR